MRKVWYVVAAGVALAVSLTLAASVSAQSKHSALKRPKIYVFLGTGQMTGKNGTVNFKVTPNSTGCGDEGGHTFAISGKATVTSATGKLKGATGPLKFSGFYDRDKGNFSAKFTGVLKG